MQAQPQIAQILLPNGQLQQVQMVTAGLAGNGMVSLGGAAAASQPITTSTWATSTVTTPSISLPPSTPSATDDKQQIHQQNQQQVVAATAAGNITVSNASQLLPQGISVSPQV